MSDRLDRLHEDLQALHTRLCEQTLARYSRMNPFTEDLFDWKERGQTWTKTSRGVTIYNSTTVAGDVSIGYETWIGPFCSLDGTGGLAIGHHCSISAGCQLLTHDTVRWTLSGGRAEYELSPTTIGDCCFLGTLSIVTRGTTIGAHSLVAAGAVVVDDVEPNSIVAGVPARRIGTVVVDDSGGVRLEYDGPSGSR